MIKDLYGQRHIAYFDPSIKFQHVESIENDDGYARMKNVRYLRKKIKENLSEFFFFRDMI